VSGALLATAAAAWLAAGTAHAETGTINLHFEGGAATFLTEPQTGYFGFGGSAAGALEWSILDLLGVEVEYLFGGFAEGTGAFARPDGLVHLIGVGVRLRPLNDTSGFALHVGDHPDWHQGDLHGDLWLSAHVGYVRTGDLDRFGFDAGLGYEMSLVDGFSFGPYVRYLQIVQPDDEPLDPADAKALAFGLAGTFCLTTCSVHVEPPDSDGDGIHDGLDRCPDKAEDPDGFEDDDGCPDLDNDGDTIPDAADRCPNEPEVVNGVEDDDGCPDQALAHVEQDRIVLEEMVHFEFATAVLRPESLAVLEDVARLILAHPEYTRISIEGHTDYQGPEEFNLRLSERRAERIRDTLIRMGVEPERLVARGFGTSQPIAEGHSIEANRQNRRVEFVIVERRP
jgi:outer membrane protein OmpA-like peptidoglycan-associated protein